MNTIKVKDLDFTVSIPREEIQKRVAELARQISKDMEGKNPLFVSVLNGSFVFAADLIRGVDTPCEITFIRLASYVGTESSGNVQELMGLKEDISGRSVVVVEDIIDSGLTMKGLIDSLKKQNPSEIRIASLLVKPGNMKVELDIPYCCFRIPNDFIVGYGLDYDGFGRNLADIYTVVK